MIDFEKRIAEIGPPKTKNGDTGTFLRSAYQDRVTVEDVCRLGRGEHVLDLGCGYGRLGIAFADTGVFYHGADVNAKRLEYAERLLAGSDAKLYNLDTVNTRYNPEGGGHVALPFPDRHFAAAFAISVFTHMADFVQVRAHVRELHRVLKPDGALYATWLTDAEEMAATPQTDHRSYYPTGTVYQLLTDAGFEVGRMVGAGTVQDHTRILARRLS